jgi:hypothetical protein
MADHDFIEDCDDCQKEKFDRTEFGLFGLDFLVTKRMMNRLLKAHGLKLRVKTNRKQWGAQSEIKLEAING